VVVFGTDDSCDWRGRGISSLRNRYLASRPLRLIRGMRYQCALPARTQLPIDAQTVHVEYWTGICPVCQLIGTYPRELASIAASHRQRLTAIARDG
jgi:hypothetical protein